MPKFGPESQFNLAQAAAPLQRLFNAVILEIDCKVLDAQRGEAEQELAFRKGNSKAHFGKSAHNYTPAVAVDVVPWPLDWNDEASFKALAAVVKRKAKELGIAIRWGGDFKSIVDMPHYELAPLKEWMAKSKLIVGTPPKYKKAPAPKINLTPVPPKPPSIFTSIFGPKETKVTDETKPNWLSGLATSTLVQYIVAFAGGAVAAKFGLDPDLFKHGVPDLIKEVSTIVGSVAAIAVALKGMHAAATPKAVVGGEVVKLANMTVTDQKAVAAIVKKSA